MAIADPFILPVDGNSANNLSLARVSTGEMKSGYQTLDGKVYLEFSHRPKATKEGPRVTTDIYLRLKKPKVDSPMDAHFMHIHFTIDRPDILDDTLGWTDAQVNQWCWSLASHIIGVGSVITKLNGRQT